MINSWEEIKNCYYVIKKCEFEKGYEINYLSEILTSALVKDINEANKIWNDIYWYHYELGDDIEIIVLDVFHKMKEILDLKNVIQLFLMDEERVEYLLESYFEYGENLEDMKDIITYCFEYNELKTYNEFYSLIFDKYRHKERYYLNIEKFIIDIYYEYNNDDKTINYMSYIDIIMQNGNNTIRDYFTIKEALKLEINFGNIEKLFDISCKRGFIDEYFELLWLGRKIYSVEELKLKWINYIYENVENGIPYNEKYELLDVTLEDTKLLYYANLIKTTDYILKYYFGCNKYNMLKYYIVKLWIKENKWDYFKFYLKIELNTLGLDFYSSKYYLLFEDYMKKEEYLRSGLVSNMVKVALETNNEDFYNYVMKFSDFDEELVNSNTFGVNQFNLGRLIAAKELKKEVSLFNRETNKKVIETEKEFLSLMSQLDDHMKIVRGMYRINSDILYELSKDLEIIKFFFDYAVNYYGFRESLISSCIQNNDLKMANYLFDRLISNFYYEEWLEKNVRVVLSLIDYFSYLKKTDGYAELDSYITDAMRLNLEEIIKNKIYPMFKENNVISKNMYKLSKENDIYVTKIESNVDILLDSIKTSKTINSVALNNISEELMNCFIRLSEINRLDTITKIMTRIAFNKSKLKIKSYDEYMIKMIGDLNIYDLGNIYEYNAGLFEIWLKGGIRDENLVLKTAISVLSLKNSEIFENYCSDIFETQGAMKKISKLLNNMYDFDFDEYDLMGKKYINKFLITV